MKRLKRACHAIVLIVLFSLTFQCASFKRNHIPTVTESFEVKTVAFQEWHTGVNGEGTGLNVFVPIINKSNHVTIDSIYFRNRKGQLVRNYSRYTAVLKNDSPKHTFDNSGKDDAYPFALTDNECAIRYLENGEVKYLKVTDVIKKDRIFYETGPPLTYQRRREAMIISEEPSKLKTIPIFQESTSFKVKTIAFQDWYAGIKVGGTGINVFVPVVNKGEHIKIDSVYFRNLKGKLVSSHGRYTAVLKNKSPNYTFTIAKKDDDFPFTLGINECAISYIENGEVKYLKVSDLTEKRGVYYENGPPPIYKRVAREVMIASNE
ncbi:MAG: hypothetical protein AB8B52_13955 [Winogradskyella sp.]|uniref:hypothetical protein n=1 Tax=Winogradskyella sp. TaxID=1883156 RepID=UPI00385FFF40